MTNYIIRSTQANGATECIPKYLTASGTWVPELKYARNFVTNGAAAEFLRDTKSQFGFVVPNPAENWEVVTDWIIERNPNTGEVRHRYHSSKTWNKGYPVVDQLTLSKNALRAFIKLCSDDNEELCEHIANILKALENKP